MTVLNAAIRWQWSRLQDLAPDKLYALFAAREAVFVVEQNCIYQEMDGLDLAALHLIAWDGDEVAACLRLLAPGVRYPQAALGRIMTVQVYRGKGLGRALMSRGLLHADALYPGGQHISAQTYLEQFYRGFGFVPVSGVYLEDGIPHLAMERRP